MSGISVLGCKHYKRKARFIAPCCNGIYTCRFCHDETEDHAMNRFSIKQLICTHCATVQRVRTICQGCGLRFGQYTCLICNLFDDEDRGQFHCTGCGLCRVGGERNFQHCDTCNMCVSVQTCENHRCVENAANGCCPICLEENMHASRLPLHMPKCGHVLHEKCSDMLKAAGHKLCPICQTSMT